MEVKSSIKNSCDIRVHFLGLAVKSIQWASHPTAHLPLDSDFETEGPRIPWKLVQCTPGSGHTHPDLAGHFPPSAPAASARSRPSALAGILATDSELVALLPPLFLLLHRQLDTIQHTLGPALPLPVQPCALCAKPSKALQSPRSKSPGPL